MPYLIVRENSDILNVYKFSDMIKIGKSDGNDIILKSSWVSREHAYIQRQEDGSYFLFDKKSTNGTYVEGSKIECYRLHHNSIFKIINYHIVFVEKDPADEYEEWQDIVQDEKESSGRTIIFDRNSAPDNSSLYSRWAPEDINQMFNILKKIIHEKDEDQLMKNVLKALLEITGASRGVLFLKSNDDNKYLVIKSKQGIREGGGPLEISRTTVRKVVEEGHSVLIHNNTNHQDIPKSVIRLDLKAVACIPLKTHRNILGCIYLDRPCDAECFSMYKLRLSKIMAYMLAVIIENVRLHRMVIEEKINLKKQLAETKPIVFKSKKMNFLYENIKKISKFRTVSVLVLGESGTGKELVAQTIHRFSSSLRKFVPVNCAAISENLFESELFGHIKGAFTGAVNDKEGFFRAADGGTLFLDEISEMPPGLQAKLLRVLQENEFVRVGDTRAIKTDVRVIAATNRDLTNESVRKEIGFRDDLYYRLQGAILHIAPLRARQEDIPVLVEHFLKRFATENDCPQPVVSDSVMKLLMSYHWPGNIRELQNLLQSAAINANGMTIMPEDLPPRILKSQNTFFSSLDEMERLHIIKALEFTQGKRKEACTILGISRDTLRRKIHQYKIE